MNLPERIFAIGGAGKEISLTLLESDWVLEEMLKPQPNPHSTVVTIIDTAEGEENEDRRRIQQIRETIAERKEELRDVDKGRTGEVSVEYKLVTEDIQLSGSIDLLGDRAVPRITAGNGMREENWWLDEQHINENLDFAKGVVRKRGLGKAIYYKAYAEDDQMSTYIDLPDKGKVAVLAGLGGGTGSGILIDLARHLQEKQRTAEITLFGILPNHTEGMKENTNAYAALSELEYLSLTDANVFKDRILLPIDPTSFDGKTGNRIQTDQFLQELDEAVIYLLASYYNTQNLEDPFASSPKYAPFTIGIPQVLRYNVEAINNARESLREILNTKQEALQAEEEIYSEVERFLVREYTDEVDQSLRDLDHADLTERLEHVEDLLAFDLFNELEYESLSIFSDIISDAKNERDDIEEQLEIIAGSLRAVDTTGQGTNSFVDDIDERLAEILEQDLRLIAHRKDLLAQIKAIDDSRVRDSIEYLIGSQDGNVNPGVKLQRLDAQLEELTEKKDRLEAELEDTIEELEAQRDAQAEEINHDVSNWMRSIRDELEQLQTLQQQSVESDLTSLQTALDTFTAEVTNAETEDAVDQVQSRPVADVLDTIEQQLEQIGIDFQEDRRDIEASLGELKQARSAFIRMNKEESTVEKLAPWQSSTEEDREQAHKDYRMQKSKLDDRGVFSVGAASSTFTVDIGYNEQTVLTEVANQKADLEDAIVDELHSRLDEPDQDDLRALRSELGRNPTEDDLKEITRQAFRQEASGTAEIETRKEKLESDLQETKTKASLYEATVDVFQNLNNRRDVYMDKRAAFHRQRDEYGSESTTQSVSTETDEYVYVKTVQPTDVFRATGDADIAESDIFKSQQENQRVRANLEELARNARNQQYTGLRKRKFSKGRSRYDDLKVRVAALSRAVGELDADALDFEETFSSAFDLGGSGKRVDSPYTSWQASIGDSWDIGLSVFIDGIFLDNLRKVVQANGYHDGYRERASKLGDDIPVHHSFGLDQGFYVRRKELLNLESPDDIELFLQNDSEAITEEILNKYVQVVKTNPEGSGPDSDTTGDVDAHHLDQAGGEYE
ncbi:tubulin-like doman-containing protein [Halorussus salinisoli]|uniref:tubulin-like doman-containing protein n=1 Tax=Halorussus salinisoli TaxID=2558242 RepID=UPI0010C1C217|nr:tubulin-like doman-containing protein [Halorussus salinisoli]